MIGSHFEPLLATLWLPFSTTLMVMSLAMYSSWWTAPFPRPAADGAGMVVTRRECSEPHDCRPRAKAAGGAGMLQSLHSSLCCDGRGRPREPRKNGGSRAVFVLADDVEVQRSPPLK